MTIDADYAVFCYGPRCSATAVAAVVAHSRCWDDRMKRIHRAWLRNGIVTALVLLVCLGLASRCHAQQTYRDAASILALAPDRAYRDEPVMLKGVVTRTTDFGFFLQDQTAGVWVFRDHPNDLSVHDVIELKGVVHQGRFSPGVLPVSIRKLGSGPLPKPTVTTVRELNTGDLDCQYVSLSGIVRSAGLRARDSQSQRLWLKIATDDGSIYASLPEKDAAAASALTDSLVEVHAVAASTKNQNRQIIGPTLMVPGMEGIRVLRGPERSIASLPLLPIQRLMQYRSGTDYLHRVKVAGTVTYYKPGESLILEEDGRALYVATVQNSAIELGDRVEAAGYPAPTSTGPILEDAILRNLAHGDPLPPKTVSAQELASGTFNHNLVRVEGRFLRRVVEPYRIVLLIQSGSTLLLAQLSENGRFNSLQDLKEGSIVRVSGISMLDAEGTWNVDGPTASAIRYEIVLRAPDDVRVIEAPSWWTMRHVIYIALVLAVLVLIFVARDIRGRIARWKLQVVLDERERMAFEMHDTLAQSLAGIGFQLQAIRKSVRGENAMLMRQVDVARALVQHSHKEARRHSEQSVVEADTSMDLLSALGECASTLVAGGSVKVETSSVGKPRAIPPLVAAALLRIGQEAIANSVRHANPERLQIVLEFMDDRVRLVLADDGCGFTKSGDLLGFGLRGMRKRAASISAALDIDSEPGGGTRVAAIAPLPPGLNLAILVKRLWKYLRGSVIHVQRD
ncbi:Histidine kinase [Granulicella pectinivorans]|uniref:Histidine kinase n=2 Tax=Granulicella pectinivorans TaxID=474950 RepID=A0A1I6M5P9_9BACT|nr:Histidine kinase [Granulicella pectinivorans]